MDAVLSDALPQSHVLRNSRHSLCVRFDWHGQTLLLKVPTARNTRRWERFTSLWRGSEARRIFDSMHRLRDLGFEGPTPVLYAETRAHLMVQSSFIIYVFLPGRPVEVKDLGQVCGALTELHRHGWTRNDAKAANFLMLDEHSVGWIDFKLKRPRLLKNWWTAMELAQFASDSPEALTWLENNQRLTPVFAAARRVHFILQQLRDLRRKIKHRVKPQPGKNR